MLPKKIDIAEFTNFLALFLLLLFHLITHTLYIYKTTRPPMEDEYHYLAASIEYYRGFINMGVVGLLDATIHLKWPVGPTYPFTVFLAFLIFGISNSYKIAVFINYIYLAITILAVYKIGEILHSREAGLLATLVTSTYPHFLWLSRQSLTETATTAMVALSAYFLIKSNQLRDTKHTILLAFSLALGCLTKLTFPFFILGGLLLIFVDAISPCELIHGRTSTKNAFCNFWGMRYNILLLISILLLPFLFYLYNYDSVVNYAKGQIGEREKYMGSVSFFSLESVLFYPLTLNRDITTPFFLLLLVGIAFSLTRHITKTKYIVACLFFSYAVHTFFVGVRHARLFVPAYPFIGIISTLWVADIKNTLGRKIVESLIVFAVLIIFFTATWNLGPLKNKYLFSIENPLESELPKVPNADYRIYLGPPIQEPKQIKTNVDSLINLLYSDSRYEKKENPAILLLTYIPEINYEFYWKTTFTDRKPPVLLSPDDAGHVRYRSISEADYIIIKTGVISDLYFGEERTRSLFVMDAIVKTIVEKSGNFKLLDEIPIPYDNSKFLVYKRIRAQDENETEHLAVLIPFSDSQQKHELAQYIRNTSNKSYYLLSDISNLLPPSSDSIVGSFSRTYATVGVRFYCTSNIDPHHVKIRVFAKPYNVEPCGALVARISPDNKTWSPPIIVANPKSPSGWHEADVPPQFINPFGYTYIHLDTEDTACSCCEDASYKIGRDTTPPINNNSFYCVGSRCNPFKDGAIIENGDLFVQLLLVSDALPTP